jgi:hypothetical protein
MAEEIEFVPTRKVLIEKTKKLKDEEKWNTYVNVNKEPYGACCVNVARRVMEILDEDPTPLRMGYHPDIHTAHGIICKADKDIDAGGITGFMAGAVSRMVFDCHERGQEFYDSYKND